MKNIVARLLRKRPVSVSISGKLHTFWHVPRPMKGLLLRLPWMIGGMRLGLHLFSFQKVLDFVERRSQRSTPATLSSSEIAWAVNRVGQRLLPKRPCLTLALVAKLLLQRRGYPATLRIGVKLEESQFYAHAWIENNGRVIVGRLDDLESFTALPLTDNRRDSGSKLTNPLVQQV